MLKTSLVPTTRQLSLGGISSQTHQKEAEIASLSPVLAAFALRYLRAWPQRSGHEKSSACPLAKRTTHADRDKAKE